MSDELHFDWDEGNSLKCQKHGVSKAEIEALMRSDPLVVADKRHSGLEERSIAIGTGRDGRLLFVGFTIRVKDGQRLVRPITARYMRTKEFLRYAKTDSEI